MTRNLPIAVSTEPTFCTLNKSLCNLSSTSVDIHEKTLHFVERAEPIPLASSTANTSNTSAPNVSASGHASGGINQTLLDDVNETTSIFINGLPGSAVLQPNDIQVHFAIDS